jgi:hypothetical protein
MLYRIFQREIGYNRPAGPWQIVVVTVKRRKKRLWTEKEVAYFMKEWAPRMARAGTPGVDSSDQPCLPRWEFKAELIETRHGLPPNS